MRPATLQILCDPFSKAALRLEDAVSDQSGNIISGVLVGDEKRRYPIIDGVPRFVANTVSQETVTSFGDQWDELNFDKFKSNWLAHAVTNSYEGSTDVFKGKIVVDAGAGSGIHSRWISEAGAKLVYSLELSHSVDGVIKQNLRGLDNVEVIQCSIDQVPFCDGIADLVYCMNVIQHTPSVKKTATELYRLAREGGELDFTCYNELTYGIGLRGVIKRNVYRVMRGLLSRCSFGVLLTYSRLMAALRFVPVAGWALEGAFFMVRGDVPRGNDSWFRWKWRGYKQTVLNTFDIFGSHSYQHILSKDELRAIIRSLQPDDTRVLNFERAFEWPPRAACAFRIFKSGNPSDHFVASGQ